MRIHLVPLLPLLLPLAVAAEAAADDDEKQEASGPHDGVDSPVRHYREHKSALYRLHTRSACDWQL